MFNKELWEKAKSVPAMDKSALLRFMYVDGFIDEIIELSSYTVESHFIRYYAYAEKGHGTATRSELKEIFLVYNQCLLNPEFRRVTTTMSQDIDKLLWLLADEGDTMNVDFSLLCDVPIHDNAKCKRYMDISGLADAIDMIYHAMSWLNSGHVNECVEIHGYSSHIITKCTAEEVLSEDRLRIMYFSYMYLCNRIMAEGGTDVVVEMFGLHEFRGYGNYGYVWKYLKERFGGKASSNNGGLNTLLGAANASDIK